MIGDSRDTRRIAVLLPDLRPGGAERLHLSLAHAWISRGFDVEFVLRQARGGLLDELPIGASVVSLHASRVRGSVLPLARYLRRKRPVALLAAMWPLTVVAVAAARLARYEGRVLGSEHSPLSLAYANRGHLHRWFLAASQRFAYPRLDAVIGVSTGVVEDLSRLSGLPRNTFTVLHNPAALGVQSDGAPEPSDLIGAARPLVLSVGTLKRVKRQDLLIDAFARLPLDHRGTLCILGDGPERESLMAQVGSLGLQHCVLMPGFVSDPGPWYAAADLFVLSSDYEGFGNVIVEAMEHGIRIVSTDCVAGPSEILEKGKYGRLVPVGDAQALAAEIRNSLLAPVDKAALQARARDFSLDVVAERYLDLLDPTWRAGAGA